MSGWEMTKGSFSHSGYNAKIHKSTNSWDFVDGKWTKIHEA